MSDTSKKSGCHESNRFRAIEHRQSGYVCVLCLDEKVKITMGNILGFFGPVSLKGTAHWSSG